MNSSKQQLISTLKRQYLSVGILAANWLTLPTQLEILARRKLNILHFDIADGHFSPLFTVGASAIKSFPDHFFKDVHLMVDKPLLVAKQCVENGANLVTLQIEQQQALYETIEWLSSQQSHYLGKMRPVLIGLSLCPETPLSALSDYIDEIDVMQILTLDPRTGQKYPAEFVLNRVEALNHLLGERRNTKLVNIDGAMTLSLAQYVKRAQPIDWIVSGSALFTDSLENTLSHWQSLNS